MKGEGWSESAEEGVRDRKGRVPCIETTSKAHLLLLIVTRPRDQRGMYEINFIVGKSPDASNADSA